MQAAFDHLEFRLAPHDVFSLDRAAAAAITVLCGSVWITRDGDRTDHVLKAGQSLEVNGNASVLVSALTRAQVSVEGAARRRTGIVNKPRGILGRGARRLMAAYLRGFRGMVARAAARRMGIAPLSYL